MVIVLLNVRSFAIDLMTEIQKEQISGKLHIATIMDDNISSAWTRNS